MNQIVQRKVEELRTVLDEEMTKDLVKIEKDVTTKYTLADLIRDGSKVTTKAVGWGNGETACALSAAYIAAKARGYVK